MTLKARRPGSAGQSSPGGIIKKKVIKVIVLMVVISVVK